MYSRSLKVDLDYIVRYCTEVYCSHMERSSYLHTRAKHVLLQTKTLQRMVTQMTASALSARDDLKNKVMVRSKYFVCYLLDNYSHKCTYSSMYLCQ